MKTFFALCHSFVSVRVVINKCFDEIIVRLVRSTAGEENLAAAERFKSRQVKYFKCCHGGFIEKLLLLF